MSSTVEQIKSRLSIVDLVSSYLKLERAGGNLKAKCPFHNEKTPSFYVSPARESYHCFGCNKGGDIFSFVEEMEGVEFVDALKILAEKTGVKIERQDAQFSSERGRLIAVMEAAVNFYRGVLAKTPDAVAYLKKRGLTDKTIEDFRIGFAPDAWKDLYAHLRTKGFTDTEIDKAGLAIKSDRGGGLYDRFRNRIMFPIFNVSGTPVAFSGRVFERDGSFGTAGASAGKYINSPQTLLFDKSKILFGFDRGRTLMRTTDTCVIVEGQMDLIMSHQAGHVNTVAVSGTALTEEHLKNIKRLANKLVMAFDGDAAGFRAAGRGVDLALGMGMDVRVAKLPDDIDPADLILKDPAEWEKAVALAKHIIDFYFEVITGKGYEPRQLKQEIEKTVLPYISKIKSRIEQAHFVDAAARIMNISEGPVWDELKKLSFSAGLHESAHKAAASGGAPIAPEPEKRAARLLHKIHGVILWQKQKQKTPDAAIDSALMEAELVKILSGTPYEIILKAASPQDEDKKIFEAELTFDGVVKLEQEVRNMMLNLEEEILREKLLESMQKLKEAETAGRKEEVAEHLARCNSLNLEISKIKTAKNQQI